MQWKIEKFDQLSNTWKRVNDFLYKSLNSGTRKLKGFRSLNKSDFFRIRRYLKPAKYY